ncbi:MAG: hypothetical protein AAF415_00395 [Pseudomonadota bacterium]
MSATRLGILCGLQSEFDALRLWPHDRRVRVAVSGARPNLAEDGARWLIDEGCTILLSFGLAGGLDPALQPGEPVRATHLRGPDGTVWALGEIPRLMEAVPTDATLLQGSETMVLSAAEKAALHSTSGAVAVDMESHRAALVAAEAGLPLHALRVVGDPAEQSLPAYVSQAVTETGHPRIGAALWGLARAPWTLPDLLRLKRDTDAGLKRLEGLVKNGALAALLPGEKGLPDGGC